MQDDLSCVLGQDLCGVSSLCRDRHPVHVLMASVELDRSTATKMNVRGPIGLTKFRDVVVCCQPILLFQRKERASKNQKQNTVTLPARSGSELKSRGHGR
jgi:hypothetical protein